MVSAIPPVPQMMGVPRLVTGKAITSVLGDPTWPLEQERALRRRIVLKALDALHTELKAPQLFHAA